MTYKSMLAHIVPRLTSQTENAATDALFYLFRRYPVALKAFTAYVSNLGVHLPADLHFDEQRLMGQAIPDLIGTDEDEQRVLMVESKFWAILTHNQPITYLQHLASEKESILLFVAPSSRILNLWQQLTERCARKGFPIDQEITQWSEYHVAKVEPGKVLGLVSWESLLTYLKKALEDNGVIEGAYEVWQLQGLCERLDAEGFHTLLAEDLQSSADVETEKYHRLADALLEILVEKDYASSGKEYRTTSGADFYKRYMTLDGHKNWCIEFNQTYWASFAPTPIWLTLYFKSQTQAKEKFNSLREKSPNKIYLDKHSILIPLELALGVEREDVLKHLVRQIEEVSPFLGV